MASRSRNTEEEKDEDIGLFSTKDSVKAISSPVKKKIMDALREGDMSFDEIVAYCGKAKSTISVHIHDLEQAGLIALRPHPADNRRKILTLTSTTLGRLTNIDRDALLRTDDPDNKPAEFTPGDIASFFRWCVRVFRTEAMILGINIDPVLERSGWQIGSVLAPLVCDPDLTSMVQKMDTFWREYGLGNIELTCHDPIVLTVEGCFECEELPITGHGACSFDTGVLSAIFTRVMNGPVTVTETECYSSGFSHCRFLITPVSESDMGEDQNNQVFLAEN